VHLVTKRYVTESKAGGRLLFAINEAVNTRLFWLMPRILSRNRSSHSSECSFYGLLDFSAVGNKRDSVGSAVARLLWLALPRQIAPSWQRNL
jgi:hypothetical protein